MTSSETRSEARTTTRVPSRDGTEIGYWTSGDGPPLLLVHGSLGDHTRWEALRPHLEPHVTVHAMDRRGRGASGDAPDYALARESEDVAAVVDAVAAEAGSPVDVYCSSYGGICALGATALTTNIRRLALYEAWPPVDPEAFAPLASFLERLEALLVAGDHEGATVLAYRVLVQMQDEEIEALRARPSWPARVAVAPTLPREVRAIAESRFDPAFAASVTVPVLLIIGSETPAERHAAETVAAAFPDARVVVLEGQAHVADLFAPELVAEQLLPFLGERP